MFLSVYDDSVNFSFISLTQRNSMDDLHISTDDIPVGGFPADDRTEDLLIPGTATGHGERPGDQNRSVPREPTMGLQVSFDDKDTTTGYPAAEGNGCPVGIVVNNVAGGT